MEKTMPSQTICAIPKVTMDHEGIFKFVQIRGPDGQTHLFGTAKYMTHKLQFESGFLAQVAKVDFPPDFNVRVQIEGFACMGGGIIKIDSSKKTVTVSDYSRIYGPYNPATVKALLEEYVKEKLPGFSVEIS